VEREALICVFGQVFEVPRKEREDGQLGDPKIWGDWEEGGDSRPWQGVALLPCEKCEGEVVKAMTGVVVVFSVGCKGGGEGGKRAREEEQRRWGGAGASAHGCAVIRGVVPGGAWEHWCHHRRLGGGGGGRGGCDRAGENGDQVAHGRLPRRTCHLRPLPRIPQPPRQVRGGDALLRAQRQVSHHLLFPLPPSPWD
jgi:hypothetical protein